MSAPARKKAAPAAHVDTTIRVLGAGVAGLTTAIRLAHAGARVHVFDRRADSGVAHGSRCDAIENWTTDEDFAQQLKCWSIDPDFLHRPAVLRVCTYDGRCYDLGDRARPLLYLVRRGPAPWSLEGSLKRHALEAGVTLTYGAKVPPHRVDVVATGWPRRGRFLDVALTFQSNAPDCIVILFDQDVAPGALAYLVVAGGMGTLAILLTRRMHEARERLARAVAAFQRLMPIDLHDARLHSGFGGALGSMPSGTGLVVGEAAGFLDYLWGFGIRHAMFSGALAARSILSGVGYEKLVAQELQPLIDCSLINRALFQAAGNRLHGSLVRVVSASPRSAALLQRAYRSHGLRRTVGSWIRRAM